MMRKIGKYLCGFLGALMLFGLFPVQAQAASVMEGARVYDDYDLLSAQEEEELEAYAAGVIEQYQMDCVFVSSDGLGGKTAEEYADDFYDENGFGVGDSKDGTLFLVDMAERKFHISTTGKAIDIIDDDIVDAMVNQVQHFLKNGRYYDAVSYYMSRTAYFYEKARTMEEEAVSESAGSDTGEVALGETGKSAPETEETGKDTAVAAISQEVSAEEEAAAGTNGTDIAEENDYVTDETQLSEEETTMFPVTAALISGGFLIFLIVKHKTVRREKGAANYLKRDSIYFSKKNDIFLRSNTVKSKIQRDEDRSGSSGRSTRNRSTTHRSSSGRRHGGGGGSF